VPRPEFLHGLRGKPCSAHGSDLKLVRQGRHLARRDGRGLSGALGPPEVEAGVTLEEIHEDSEMVRAVWQV
jgi:hypothetical protein